MTKSRALNAGEEAGAVAMLAAGSSERDVAKHFGVSRGCIIKVKSRTNPAPTTSASAKTSTKSKTTRSKAPKKLSVDAVLDEDLRQRVATRDTLVELLAQAKDKGDLQASARLAKELNAVLDGLRRVVTVAQTEPDAPNKQADLAASVLQRLQTIRDRKSPVVPVDDEEADPAVPLNVAKPG